MYDKIDKGKHIKKINSVEIEAKEPPKDKNAP